MKKIIAYIGLYFKEADKKVLLLTTLITAVMIFCNYYFHIDRWINKNTFALRFIYRFLISLLAFTIPYYLYNLFAGKKYFSDKFFLTLLLVAASLFSLKMSLSIHFPLSSNEQWDVYWNKVIYWPLRLIIVILVLLLVWKKFDTAKTFFGFTIHNFNWKPYAGMLLIMIPLIAAASTQPDFLSMYPKIKTVSPGIMNAPHSWFYKLLFELSYGTDFISIELFFRGFLVLAFLKWAGKDAILPMACFYCTIHFGKPIGECISSYFGGLLLGIVVYHTRSIFGGLIVHLGIAWMMEIGGYIGNAF
ncbi:MAG: CPBP family intramembrane metalloprotease [Chitinophagaceae bacterium]